MNNVLSWTVGIVTGVVVLILLAPFAMWVGSKIGEWWQDFINEEDRPYGI